VSKHKKSSVVVDIEAETRGMTAEQVIDFGKFCKDKAAQFSRASALLLRKGKHMKRAQRTEAA